MRKFAIRRRVLLALVLGTLPVAVMAQCTTSVIDWDYREYFARNNGTIRTYTSLAQSQTQYFAMGANTVTIQHNYTTNSTVAGVSTTHTGEAGSYGSGADLRFYGDGTVTFTFATAVTDLHFSLYDVDRYQRVNVIANNGGSGTNVSLTGGSNISFTNNNTSNARASASSSSVNNSSTNNNVHVWINGPVTTVTLQISNTGTSMSEDGDYFISDITACVAGSFPNNYYAVSRPFTGMPSYVIVVLDGTFYYVDPATGKAKLLFTDAGHNRMNSVSYDPYNRFVYYTYSLSGSGGGVNSNQKTLRRYNYNTNTYGPLVNDITTLGIPTFEQGVESAAGAFYNGNLYLGVEGGSDLTKSIIWRINFNGSNNPTTFSQVYAQTAETSGGTRLHDWSDFGISDGVLYDFDGGSVSSLSYMNFFQQDLLTGNVIDYTPASGVVPRQVAVDWTGQVYNVGSPSASASGTIAPYNGTNNVGDGPSITYNGTAISGSWGDAGEAFRPFCDFGDAPTTYEGADPTWGLAVHEPLANLSLGASLDVEWLKKGVSTTEDTDDGMVYTPILAPGNPNYFFQARVFNNTGEPATLCAWLDFNDNGVFDPSEGKIYTVPSSPSIQTIWVYWTGISVSPSLVLGTYTYLRMRVAPASAGMTVNNPTGYYDGGEVEDFRVIVDNYPLAVNMLSFDAKVVNKTMVDLDWNAVGEDAQFAGYQVMRSRDGQNWEMIGMVASGRTAGNHAYSFLDKQPYIGTSYYRLLIGQNKYSDTRSVTIGDEKAFTLSPNPARDKVVISITGENRNEQADISILTVEGKTLYTTRQTLNAGPNNITIPVNSKWAAGTYLVQIATPAGNRQQKLVIRP